MLLERGLGGGRVAAGGVGVEVEVGAGWALVGGGLLLLRVQVEFVVV